MTALRVTNNGTGRIMWIGEPDANGFAPLVPSAEFHDWSQYAQVIQVSGCMISPNESYDIQSLLDIDDPMNEASYSAALTLPTIAQWGDVAGSGALPDGTANFADVSSLVACFVGGAGALPPAQCNLSPQEVDGTANFVDINAGVSAFQAAGYPFAAPGACP